MRKGPAPRCICCQCLKLKRDYGQGLCRTCWKARAKLRLSEYRLRMEIKDNARSVIGVATAGRNRHERLQGGIPDPSSEGLRNG